MEGKQQSVRISPDNVVVPATKMSIPMETETLKCARVICQVVKGISIEPVMFFHAASVMMMFIIVQSLKIYKVCRGTFDRPDEVCHNLTAYPDLKKEVQKVASNLGMYWSIIQTVPSLIFILFLGPWSDRHGRKLPMVLSLIGTVLSAVVFILSAVFDQLSPYFLLVGPAFMGISGGMMGMIMAVFSYITDISDKETRTIRIGLVYGAWFLGSPSGSVMGGILMSQYGYTAVFSVGASILIFCILYLILRIKEAPLPSDATWKSKGFIKDMFNLSNVMESFHTCFKIRKEKKRMYLWLLMLSLCGLFLPITGEGNVRYLFSQLQFDWDETMYSYYTASFLGVGAIGCIAIMPILTKVFGVKDLLMAMLAIIAKISVEFVTAFSVSTWMMFIASVPLLYECAGPPIRSQMTRCVEPNEVGKMFSALAVIESGIPILSGVMYSQVYSATISTFPGSVFMISAAIYAFVLIIIIWINHDMKKLNLDHEKDVENPEKNIQNDNHNTKPDLQCNNLPKESYTNKNFIIDGNEITKL